MGPWNESPFRNSRRLDPQESATNVRSTAHHRTLIRRWDAALDELTCQAYIGTLDAANRWILDTALTWLSKDP
eukprot:8330877-Lingulodinium_polyedra.AAC.1